MALEQSRNANGLAFKVARRKRGLEGNLDGIYLGLESSALSFLSVCLSVCLFLETTKHNFEEVDAVSRPCSGVAYGVLCCR